MAVLPRYAAIKSMEDGQYLSYTKEDGKFRGYLKYSAAYVVTPFTKFEIEPAKTSTNFFNIRNCYNNKYWALIDANTKWIGAVADEPNEDQSSRLCTLFEPSYRSTTDSMQLRHVKLDKYVYSWTDEDSEYYKCLYADDPADPYATPYHRAVDWESFVILPKFVAVKGDNGKYLHTKRLNGQNFLQFSADDIGDKSVVNEVSYYLNGCLQFKSIDVRKYWITSNGNWVRAEAESSQRSEYFWGKKINNNTMALRGYPSHLFCQRLTADGVSDCLKAACSTMMKETHLTVEEPVISRSIYNVSFDLLNSRIYNQTVLTMATGNAINRSHEKTSVTLKLSYTDTNSNQWDCGLSMKLGVEFSLSSGIPLIFEGGIKVKTEFSASYSWGKTHQTSKTVETDYQVPVPPMTKVKVRLVATQGHCDIPFSYVKRDTLFNGDINIDGLDDGIYKGVNCYNFKYENEETPL